ncbi:MAG: exonuclease SbcCD subunit D [Myxococcota bacterium]
MRIVHTSDWHAGRQWKGVDRLPELERALDGLAAYVERHDVDLLLVTGDVFDTGSPPPRAEGVVFRFLKRVGATGARTVVIAGNHDHPTRLEAWGTLAELVGVTAVGTPRSRSRGGLLTIETRSGERARVAALPFAPTRLWVDAAGLVADPGAAALKYADGLARVLADLSAGFGADSVNLVCAHTHLDGAFIGGSERRVHLGDDWAATVQSLPATAHYVALGHIHRPQELVAPAPTAYAGSPLQLDFGEAGQDKSFVVIDAVAGAPARISRVPYEGGRPLIVVRGTVAEVSSRASALAHAWVKVVLPASESAPDVARKVRQAVPTAVAVDLERAEPVAEPVVERAAQSPLAAYRAYVAHAHGRDPDPALCALFDELYATALEAP